MSKANNAPFLPADAKIPRAVREEIEAGWLRYRGRGHSRKSYGHKIVLLCVALGKLAGVVPS